MATVYLSEPGKMYGDQPEGCWHRKYENVKFKGFVHVKAPLFRRDYHQNTEGKYEWLEQLDTSYSTDVPVIEGLDPSDLPYRFFRYDEEGRLYLVRRREYYNSHDNDAPDGRNWVTQHAVDADKRCVTIVLDENDPLDADVCLTVDNGASKIDLYTGNVQLAIFKNGKQMTGAIHWPPTWSRTATIWDVIRARDNEIEHDMWSLYQGSEASRIATDPTRIDNVMRELRLGDLQPVARDDGTRFGSFFEDDKVTAPVDMPQIAGTCLTLALTDDLSGYSQRHEWAGYGALVTDSEGSIPYTGWAQPFQAHTSFVKIARALDGFRFCFFLFTRMRVRPEHILSKCNLADGFVITAVTVPYGDIQRPETRKTWAALGRTLCNAVNRVHGLAMAMTIALNTVRGRVVKWGGKVGDLSAINEEAVMLKLPKNMAFRLGNQPSRKHEFRARGKRKDIQQLAREWWNGVRDVLIASEAMLFEWCETSGLKTGAAPEPMVQRRVLEL